VKTRTTRRRPVTVQLGEQSLEIQAPGFKAIRRGAEKQFYWIKDDHAEFALYEPKTVRIYVDGLDSQAACERIQRICLREQEAMLAWADENASDRERLGPKYDGTLNSVIVLYTDDEESSFQNLKDNTKQSYADSLKVVADTIGLRRLDRLHPKNFRRYYNNWRAPAEAGGEERVRRAYGCIQMVRVVLSYGIEADIPECKRLRDGLTRMSFEKNPPREEIMTFEQAEAIVGVCLKANDVSMALTQAVAFDCMFRQGDIRGDWREESSTYELRSGEVRRGSKVWSGMTIDQLQPDGVLSVRTSKTGQPVAHVIDKCTLVMRCLERLDRSNPFAPVAARPDGKPWPDRQSFAKAWRKYATTAGLPKNVWNMDNRASAITEAAAAGASDDDIASTGAHDNKRTTRAIYKRQARQISERVQAARQASRPNNRGSE
jgi:hypothetical protein